ncbi:unnamed protein product [Lactuca virosa]|uniref:Uncharacterized protein n=1 Tax=Lactuca virosa TaxID=75947 RepID=A0AAU9PGJ7_9ASTR|nr:unnamed protein product [Lactuca virosa]
MIHVHLQLEQLWWLDLGPDPNVNYYKIQYEALCIHENPRCIFIATNNGATINMTNLQECSGVGCMVAVVYGATKKELTVVGKPPIFLMDLLQKMYQIHHPIKIKTRNSKILRRKIKLIQR